MSTPYNDILSHDANRRRLFIEGAPIIVFGQLGVTAYRKAFDPSAGYFNVVGDLVCTGIGHLFVHCRYWRLLPLPVDSLPAQYGIARRVWCYATQPRVLGYFGICTGGHMAMLALRHLRPKLVVQTAGFLRHVAPSQWGQLAKSRLPSMALKVVGTAAGCWAVSVLGTISDTDTLNMIRDPEADKRRDAYFNEESNEWKMILIQQAITALMLGIWYGIRLSVRKS